MGAAEEQAALRRVAMLLAAGASEHDLAVAVASEIGALFGAELASTMRWDGDTLRVIGDWAEEPREREESGRTFAYGGDTITARIIETAAPARVDSAADLQTEFARRRWADLGLKASIGAPIVVDGSVWGVVTAFRTRPDDPFEPGDEERLRDYAALLAQAIVNAEARRETAQLVAEQSTLRRIATLVAAGCPQSEVLAVVTSEAGVLFDATTVTISRWSGAPDEVIALALWDDRDPAPVGFGSIRLDRAGPTVTVLETGVASRSEHEIAAPVILSRTLLGALTATRVGGRPFRAGDEVRLRSFADLAAQSIANEQAQTELRASRARIVRAADESRQQLERNLHDGAQQRLVSLSLALRLIESKLQTDPARAHELVTSAREELALALEELRELARGLHPAILTDRGLVPALEALAERSPVPVELQLELDERLPEQCEAAIFYVVSESLTNIAKYAHATAAYVRVAVDEKRVVAAVTDDGVGGADPDRGSGLRGLADRVSALDGLFEIESSPGRGTTVRAALPVRQAVPQIAG
jgi:signal transduction histidine kinase